MTVLIIIALQYIVSAKAAWVNYVDVQVSVQMHEQVAVDMPIETGPRSHAELLLSPGSFLRVGEQSSVVFDSIELTNIAVRVLKGAAIIEVAEADKHTTIHVATGNLRTVIVSPGLYRFSGDTAIVMDGKLRTVDPTTIIRLPLVLRIHVHSRAHFWMVARRDSPPDLNLAFLRSCWGAEWLFQHWPFRRTHFRSSRRPQVKASNHESLSSFGWREFDVSRFEWAYARTTDRLQTRVPVRFREKMDPYQDAILDQRCWSGALRFENEQLA
jgi:FecR protein